MFELAFKDENATPNNFCFPLLESSITGPPELPELIGLFSKKNKKLSILKNE